MGLKVHSWVGVYMAKERFPSCRAALACFVVIEFVDKNGSIYHTARVFVYNPYKPRDIYVPSLSFDWIPPGKSYRFCYIGDATLLKYVDSIKVEFFNIGNEEFGFINLSDETFNSFNLQLLEMVDVKLTSEIQQIEKEIYIPITEENVDYYYAKFRGFRVATISKTGSWEVPETRINRFDVWLARVLTRFSEHSFNSFLRIAEKESSFVLEITGRRYYFDVNSQDKLCVPILLESAYNLSGDSILSDNTQEIIIRMDTESEEHSYKYRWWEEPLSQPHEN